MFNGYMTILLPYISVFHWWLSKIMKNFTRYFPKIRCIWLAKKTVLFWFKFHKMYIFNFNHKILTLPIAIYLRLIPHLVHSFNIILVLVPCSYLLGASNTPYLNKKVYWRILPQKFYKTQKKKKKSTYPEQACQ